jgi:hypothetical protein
MTSRAKHCLTCGSTIVAKHTGRKRKYCSAKCRDAHRRQLNFEVSGTARYPTQAKPRNAENPPTVSKNCEVDFAGRASPDLWRRILEIEVIAPHGWSLIVSSDGVKSEQTFLRPPALVEKGLAS